MSAVIKNKGKPERKQRRLRKKEKIEKTENRKKLIDIK